MLLSAAQIANLCVRRGKLDQMCIAESRGEVVELVFPKIDHLEKGNQHDDTLTLLVAKLFISFLN